MKRYYIKAVGSACYDVNGLTFPKKVTCKFEGIVRYMRVKNPRWRREYKEISNTPKVLAFTCDHDNAKAIERIINEKCGKYFIVREVYN